MKHSGKYRPGSAAKGKLRRSRLYHLDDLRRRETSPAPRGWRRQDVHWRSVPRNGLGGLNYSTSCRPTVAHCMDRPRKCDPITAIVEEESGTGGLRRLPGAVKRVRSSAPGCPLWGGSRVPGGCRLVGASVREAVNFHAVMLQLTLTWHLDMSILVPEHSLLGCLLLDIRGMMLRCRRVALLYDRVTGSSTKCGHGTGEGWPCPPFMSITFWWLIAK